MYYPTTNKEKAALYIKAMHEIRERLRCVDGFLLGSLPARIRYECCHLQLRLACECFAIACLAAQGDFQTHKSFRDRYEPSLIFKKLERLYPSFFPTPSALLSRGEGNWHFDDVGHGNPISRNEVEDIWNRSGNHLHRGSAKRYVRGGQDIDFMAVSKAKEKMWNLIMGHMIILSDHTSRFHVAMERDSNKLRCHFLFLDVDKGEARVETYDAD